MRKSSRALIAKEKADNIKARKLAELPAFGL